MKKKIIAIGMAVMLALSMTACGENKDNYTKDETMIINVIETGSVHTVFVDTETGVMYLRTYNGGVCVMVNPDGTPKIWGE
ncbi:MAG: DUF6440 family protein [Firmicutes bacterium]|nr:DUF6440 family protein [Bacillota bacterium]